MASQQNFSGVALTEVNPQELREVQGGCTVFIRFGGKTIYLRHRDFYAGVGRFRHLVASQVLNLPFPFFPSVVRW